MRAITDDSYWYRNEASSLFFTVPTRPRRQAAVLPHYVHHSLPVLFATKRHGIQRNKCQQTQNTTTDDKENDNAKRCCSSSLTED